MRAGEISDRDRLLPDCVGALSAGKTVIVRRPDSVRPWQHVLEPLSGYLLLGAEAFRRPRDTDYGWNFGPSTHQSVSVRDVVRDAVGVWGGGKWEERPDGNAPHEAGVLRLDCTKAAVQLGWRGIYSTRQAVEKTVRWYKNFYTISGFDARAYSLSEIASYMRQAREQGLAWASDPKGPIPCPLKT